MQSRIFIVANRLPVSAQQTSNGIQFQPSPGGMAAALRGVTRGANTIWLGYPGIDLPISEEQLQASGLPKNALPLHIPADDYDDYYYGVSNGSIWPIFHGFAPRKLYAHKQWKTFLRVTERFADRLQELVKPNDIIWIHDYQLCMLPAVLRKRGIQNKIGFFLHIPFPDAKTLQMIPHYRDILSSLSETNVTGFQARRDVANFKAALVAANMPKTKAVIKAFPVGIDYEMYAAAHKKAEVRRNARAIFTRLKDKTVIFSISRLDYTKGILQQLTGFEKMLKRVDDPQKYVYQLTVAPSRENLGEYEDTRKQIEKMAASINKRWATANWKPIEYVYRNFPLEEVTAWYLRADVMLVAPLQDGMNLIAKEYVAVRPEDDGILVLSNRAGAAEQMRSAIQCDPRDTDAVAEALHRAVHMTLAQKKRAMSALRKLVREQSSATWAANFLQTLGLE